VAARGRLLGGDRGAGASGEYRGPEARRTTIAWGRRVLLGVLLLLVVFFVWAVASWISFSGGVTSANQRLDPDAKAALASQGGLLLSHPSTILLLGIDNSANPARASDRHSDSIMLMRTDPARHRIYYLSIPRDLQVPIPGYPTQKINAAMQLGGAALAIKTISNFTGLPINHVVVVNFGDFKTLIDRLGGITIDVPKPILSDRFDCPYTNARCQTWRGWRFGKGPQHMNGQRALIYSRIRVNQLDPTETDVTRGARQQAVMQAVLARFTSPTVLLELPFDGGSLARPLTTDMSAWQLVQFGWVRMRASTSGSVHCRLGGDLGGGGTGTPSEDNPTTIAMFLGESAPQPPTDAFGPGCFVGRTLQ